jgi:hypothetical protein
LRNYDTDGVQAASGVVSWRHEVDPPFEQTVSRVCCGARRPVPDGNDHYPDHHSQLKIVCWGSVCKVSAGALERDFSRWVVSRLLKKSREAAWCDVIDAEFALNSFWLGGYKGGVAPFFNTLLDFRLLSACAGVIRTTRRVRLS